MKNDYSKCDCNWFRGISTVLNFISLLICSQRTCNREYCAGRCFFIHSILICHTYRLTRHKAILFGCYANELKSAIWTEKKFALEFTIFFNCGPNQNSIYVALVREEPKAVDKPNCSCECCKNFPMWDLLSRVKVEMHYYCSLSLLLSRTAWNTPHR